jgi:tyrosyl-tRNA synthetase
MGKSLGNYVGVGEPAYDQFAKTMSIPDALMRPWFELLTDRPAEEVARLTDAARTHPMEAKKALARDIVTFYHGAAAAEEAQAEWERRFSERQDPTEIPVAPVKRSNLVDGAVPAWKLLVLLKLAASGNEARRHIQQGGVTIGPERTKITDPNQMITVTPGLVVRVGRRNVVRVELV